ncbi:Ribosomal protein [Melia azedarach]|uniref:Ribosomal protein n=1 Tax=Melia azedarach TaxID=155640 RepID=A0ACC1WTK2_MELAZ|nr:Ribosomal protein [Melia azedarach]
MKIRADYDEVKDDVFDLGESVQPVAESFGDESSTSMESVRTEEEERQLQMVEKGLTAVLQGPNRAFGDLIAASGVTDAMLESLIALKDLEGVEGGGVSGQVGAIRLGISRALQTWEVGTRPPSSAEIWMTCAYSNNCGTAVLYSENYTATTGWGTGEGNYLISQILAV